MRLPLNLNATKEPAERRLHFRFITTSTSATTATAGPATATLAIATNTYLKKQH
jgi:hypothetical protein